jgi:hypothetical protein
MKVLRKNSQKDLPPKEELCRNIGGSRCKDYLGSKMVEALVKPVQVVFCLYSRKRCLGSLRPGIMPCVGLNLADFLVLSSMTKSYKSGVAR